MERLSLRELVPTPSRRYGTTPISRWSLGMTTAPRRQPTLQYCLESVVRAGFDRVHLFVDGHVEIPREYRSWIATEHSTPIGAWPNFYLALSELYLRDPSADAYLLFQDDAYCYDSENLRAYLESMLWPAPGLNILSLYSTAAVSATGFGWHSDPHRWLCGALALLFSRSALEAFLLDHRVFQYRRHGPRDGKVDIDLLLGEWAESQNVPVFYPFPSLVQHVGNTTTIWTGASNGKLRRARFFAGDIEDAFHRDLSLASFSESEFLPASALSQSYQQIVESGWRRMSQSKVVICGIGRDVRPWLPRTLARMTQLGEMFQEYRIVIVENDSQDGTAQYLAQWSRNKPHVRCISGILRDPKYSQGRSQKRTAQLARYRNEYHASVVEHFSDFDYVIVVDMDLRGGWSYEGIANTFGHTGWDFMGSYGVLEQVRPTRPPVYDLVHYDSFAFRAVGQVAAPPNHEVNTMRLQRGDAPILVWSCFGGLGVYSMPSFVAGKYSGEDCEHVQFHNRLRECGFKRLFLNPSQIVVY